jgi:hypothetical protein
VTQLMLPLSGTIFKTLINGHYRLLVFWKKRKPPNGLTPAARNERLS